MAQTLTVHLEKPIASAKILDDSAGRGRVDSAANAEQILSQDSEAQKTAFSQAYQAINSVVTKLNQFYDKIFVEHKKEIARLSVEIARKVLNQKVQKGDYKIENIVKEALKSAPERQDVVVHLNPEDFTRCRKALQKDQTSGSLTGVEFFSDDKIVRAECKIETPKGIIESMIEEHLERIGKAFEKVK